MKQSPLLAIIIVILLTTIALIAHSSVYAKEYSLSLKERSTGESIHCQLQTVGGNRVLICSEHNFELSDPIPIKKPKAEPLKPTTKRTTSSSSFLELLQRQNK